MTVAERLAQGHAPAPSRYPRVKEYKPVAETVTAGRYEDLPSVTCVECRVVFSEAVGRLHGHRTGHEIVKGTLALWD